MNLATHWTELVINVVYKCVQIQAWRAVCCRAMRTQCGVWLTPPAWSVWLPALQMGLCGSGIPIIPHRVCLFSTRRKVRRRPCAFGLFVFSVCPSHSLSVCLSFRTWDSYLGGLCKLWPVPGCCVLRWGRDSALRPQHRAKHHGPGEPG